MDSRILEGQSLIGKVVSAGGDGPGFVFMRCGSKRKKEKKKKSVLWMA